MRKRNSEREKKIHKRKEERMSAARDVNFSVEWKCKQTASVKKCQSVRKRYI